MALSPAVKTPFWMWYANTILPMRKAEEQTRDTA
jgi:hypothetical protein